MNWYKLMDLDKTFEENAATMSGKFPEEYEVRFSINNGNEKMQNESTTADNIEEIDKRFNEGLASLTEENADSIVLSLGRPSSVLRAAGVEDKPMKLYGNKVIAKMRKHGYTLYELRNLPRAVAEPIAVFNNYGKDGNRSILTELRTAKGNFLVAVDLGKGIEDIDFNIISSVFGKGEDNVVDWIERGLATYINKEKALNYLHHSALRAEALSSPRLSSATKIVENFENPSIEENDLFRNVFGGNRGYVGYSKSKRAVRAESEGMRSVSNFDADFVESVNEILRSVGADDIAIAEWMGRYECPSLGSKDAHS